MGIRKNEKGQTDYRDMFNGMCTVEELKRLCDSLVEEGYGHYGAVFGDENGKYFAVRLGASMPRDTSSAWEKQRVEIYDYYKDCAFVNYDELVYFD